MKLPIIIIIIIKATSKTQKLILIYTEVNIYFVSWTKVSLNNRPSSKALNRQNWKKVTVNRQSYHHIEALLKVRGGRIHFFLFALRVVSREFPRPGKPQSNWLVSP